MEATFCGSTLSDPPKQYSTQDFEAIGQLLSTTLLDYLTCPEKRDEALQLVKEDLLNRIKKKKPELLEKSEDLATLASMSALSDDGSASEGSDSSPSEGETEAAEIRFRLGEDALEDIESAHKKLQVLRRRDSGQFLAQNFVVSTRKKVKRKKVRKKKRRKSRMSQDSIEIEQASNKHFADVRKMNDKYEGLSNRGIPTYAENRIQQRKSKRNVSADMIQKTQSQPISANSEHSLRKSIRSAPTISNEAQATGELRRKSSSKLKNTSTKSTLRATSADLSKTFQIPSVIPERPSSDRVRTCTPDTMESQSQDSDQNHDEQSDDDNSTRKPPTSKGGRKANVYLRKALERASKEVSNHGSHLDKDSSSESDEHEPPTLTQITLQIDMDDGFDGRVQQPRRTSGGKPKICKCYKTSSSGTALTMLHQQGVRKGQRRRNTLLSHWICPKCGGVKPASSYEQFRKR